MLSSLTYLPILGVFWCQNFDLASGFGISFSSTFAHFCRTVFTQSPFKNLNSKDFNAFSLNRDLLKKKITFFVNTSFITRELNISCWINLYFCYRKLCFFILFKLTNNCPLNCFSYIDFCCKRSILYFSFLCT